jgi:hypothetical protein
MEPRIMRKLDPKKLAQLTTNYFYFGVIEFIRLIESSGPDQVSVVLGLGEFVLCRFSL